ncbi:MAG: hypothetical protein CUN48_17090, partial [Candidatus Thermofonsia Clade 3 bacterium]
AVEGAAEVGAGQVIDGRNEIAPVEGVEEVGAELEEALLAPSDLADAPILPDTAVDYGAVIPFKQRMLRRAFARFQQGFADHLRPDFEAFCETQASWLNDYALFAALKSANGGGSWSSWDAGLRSRDPAALDAARRTYADEIAYQCFIQYLFFDQWLALK